jgi:hypothetical protein
MAKAYTIKLLPVVIERTAMVDGVDGTHCASMCSYLDAWHTVAGDSRAACRLFSAELHWHKYGWIERCQLCRQSEVSNER